MAVFFGEHAAPNLRYNRMKVNEGVADMKKLNCWEFKRCGREPGGAHAGDEGICPAATDKGLDGAHNGVNAGRACWVIAGTMCEGKVHGTYAQKLGDCELCDFYALVRRETEEGFLMTIPLIRKVID
jgi:hypothetical protein